MKTPIRILYVDDSPLDRDLVLDSLEKEHGGFQVTQAASRTDFESALATGSFDLVLSDFNILGFEGLQVLEMVHAKDADLPVIIVTGTGSEEIAVEAMKRGAADYVIKTPKHIQRLPFTIGAALDKKRLECERRQSEELYQLIFENSGEAILLTNPDGTIHSANPEACRIFQRDEENLRKIGRQGVVDINDPRLPLALEERNRTGKFKGELNLIRKDGTIFPADVSTALFKDLAGNQRTSMIIRDITERRQAEGALRESEARYRDIFDGVQEAIFVETLDGKILAVNDRACEMYGYSRGEFLTKTVPDLVPVDHPILWVDGGEHTLSSIPVETINRRANGKSFPIEISGRFQTIDGKKALLVVVRDITERKRAEEKIKRQIEYLTALRDIDQSIISAFDMQMSLNVLISRAITLLDVDAITVLLVNSAMAALEFAAGMGFRTDAIRTASVKLGESYAGRAALEGQIVAIPNLVEDPENLLLTGFLKDENFVSYYGSPLIVKGKVIGVLEVFDRSIKERDQEWSSFFDMLAGQAAIAIDNAILFENLQISNTELLHAYEATIEGWSRALDLRDRETEGHTLRVTEKTIELAQRMGLPEELLAHVRRGALLHDIGKMGVPDGILLKAGQLTDHEWEIMRKHPVFAFELLSPIRYLKSAAIDIPYCHHEKWDGSGYPRNLKGEQIPLAARIFAVVDVYDALTSDRPYRPGWQKQKVLEYIQSLSGTHFDPHVVRVFLESQKQ